MIKKLPDQLHVQTGEFRGTTFDIIPRQTFCIVCRKVNELIVAVNELQATISKMEIVKTPTEKFSVTESVTNSLEKMNSQDDTSKWVGCLCRFWDDDPADYVFDILKEISVGGGYIKLGGVIYSHCEPVKPDEDIIYKGSDNEK